jgi:WXXGXW repeat (2 copies)
MKSLLSKWSLVLFLLPGLVPAAATAQVGVGIGIGVAIHTPPPLLPVYEQPPIPGEGYMWTPGYWAWGEAGYYWVPGVWVRPPMVGVLWTPGYWGFAGGAYGWHAGYWGPRIGFYGGVNYGFGYGGVGFGGGAWRGGVFAYNTAVTNVGLGVVHGTYVDRTVINNTTVINHTSFNGEGGMMARPTSMESSAMNEHHFEPTAEQTQHFTAAAHDPGQRFSANGGHPGNVAMNSVGGRAYNQQGRIAQGMGSGQLTAGESRNLEGREANINREVRGDRLASGGTLTPQERQQVNGQQNNLSHSIYDDKHNANTAHYGNNEVGDRRYNQQQRIANGVGNGTMSAGQASRVEHREQNINHSVAADRSANGGKLTPQEKQNINRRQNSTSRQIHEDKHGK